MIEKYVAQFNAFFDYDRDTSAKYPLTSPATMFAFMIGYLISIRLLAFAMSFRSKPFNITAITAVWNLIMSGLSLWMFLGTANFLFTNLSRFSLSDGIGRVFCDPQAKLSFGGDYWYYVFYLSKFVEFGDTYFLILKKKEVIFLHWYHHFVTASIIWTAWLYPVPASQWMGPLTNTFVHIFMYFYYFAQESFGVSRTIGSYVTQLQIAQFLYCLFMFFIVGILFFGGSCAYGSSNAYVYLGFQYSVFLVLFLRMNSNRKASMSKSKKEGAGETGTSKGKMNGKATPKEMKKKAQ